MKYIKLFATSAEAYNWNYNTPNVILIGNELIYDFVAAR